MQIAFARLSGSGINILEFSLQYALRFIALRAQDIHLPVELVDLFSHGTSSGFRFRQLGTQELNLGSIGGTYSVPPRACKARAIILDKARRAILVLRPAFQAIACDGRGLGYLFERRHRVDAFVVKTARNMVAHPLRHGVILELQFVDELLRAARGRRRRCKLRDSAVLEPGAHIARIDPLVNGFPRGFRNEQGGGESV